MSYKLHGPFTTHKVGNAAIVEVTDLIEGNGTVWREGAHKVTLTNKALAVSGMPASGRKLFKGETAWMDAERLFEDIEFAYRRADAGW